MLVGTILDDIRPTTRCARLKSFRLSGESRRVDPDYDANRASGFLSWCPKNLERGSSKMLRLLRSN